MQTTDIIEWVEGKLYPNMREHYTLRKAHNDTAWYVSPRTNTQRVYGLIWEESGWRLNSISGMEVERQKIEEDLLQLWEAEEP